MDMDFWRYTECVRLNYLVNGFLRDRLISNKSLVNNHLFEPLLVNLIISSLGNVFIRFDIYPIQCKYMIYENETVVKWKENAPNELCIGSSYGWNYGIHSISFECYTEYWYQTAFGITTNINAIKEKPTFIVDIKTGYHYAMFMGFIGGMENGYQDSVPIQINAFNSKKGSKTKNIITIKFNGFEWNVKFLLNGKVIGKPIEMEPYCTYYPWIGFTKKVKDILEDHNIQPPDLTVAEYRIIT